MRSKSAELHATYEVCQLDSFKYSLEMSSVRCDLVSMSPEVENLRHDWATEGRVPDRSFARELPHQNRAQCCLRPTYYPLVRRKEIVTRGHVS